MENGKLCINLYINKFEQQFNHSTMPVLKYTNITYKCVSHVKCSCFNKKILINQNKCCSFSWLMIEDRNNNSMQHNVQIWFKTSARDRGTTLLKCIEQTRVLSVKMKNIPSSLRILALQRSFCSCFLGKR